MSRVLLSDLAEADLTDMWVFVAQDNPAAADTLVDQIHETCQSLAGMPKMGRRRPGLHPSIRSFAAGAYVIFYREGRDGIEVARVLHGRRDIPALFRAERRARRKR